MIELEIGDKLLRLGGYYKNQIDVVEYKGIFHKSGYHDAVMLTEYDKNFNHCEVCHTPQPNHLFTKDGIDIHTGERTNDIVLLKHIEYREKWKAAAYHNGCPKKQLEDAFYDARLEHAIQRKEVKCQYKNVKSRNQKGSTLVVEKGKLEKESMPK